MKADFVDFVECLNTKFEIVVAISDDTHYIFHEYDEIPMAWASLYEVVEEISRNYNSIVVRIKYIEEE